MNMSKREYLKFKRDWLEITHLIKTNLPDDKDYALTCIDLSYGVGEMLYEFPHYAKRRIKNG